MRVPHPGADHRHDPCYQDRSVSVASGVSEQRVHPRLIEDRRHGGPWARLLLVPWMPHPSAVAVAGLAEARSAVVGGRHGSTTLGARPGVLSPSEDLGPVMN
jgi:hypothetical protein